MNKPLVDKHPPLPWNDSPLQPEGSLPAASLFEKAVALQLNDQPEQALIYYRKTLDAAPAMVEARYNMGILFYKQRDWRQSIIQFKKVLDLNPEFPDAAFNLASALKAMGQFKKAIQIYQMALDTAPSNAKAFYHQGICYLKIGLPDAAMKAIKQATTLEPANDNYWFHLAEACLALQHFDAAIATYRRVIELNPARVSTYYNLAVALRLSERIDEAIGCLKGAIRIDPGYHRAYPLLYRLAQHACDWPLAANLSKRMDDIARSELKQGVKTTEPPLTSIRRSDDVRLNLQIARSWSDSIRRHAHTTPRQQIYKHKSSPMDRIRIGYLSGDFRDHAVAHQIKGLLQCHDRKAYEIYGYASNPDDGTSYRQKLAAACDHFKDISAFPDQAAARLIHEDGINILVDMSGHSQGNRMGILALRPAPIQASYLGFLGTTGATFMDYIIADKIVVPEEHAAFYSEKMVYLPFCYQANDNRMPIPRQTFNRSEWELPEHAFVFCSFNQPYKIDHNLFHAWMQILKSVDQSVLWLVIRSPLARQNLTKAATSDGVDPSRLVFTGFVPMEQHLARLRLADLFLDTMVYNGGATTSNALWAGVPVLSILGRHWVSRMSASALSAIGLKALITKNLDEYQQKAIALALDPPRLKALRQRLWDNRKTEPLFNTALFTRHFENAFHQMWHRHLDGQMPASIEVQP